MDWDEDHVDLAWVKPKSDGGSPIIEYIVQKKEKGSPYWANALTVPASQTAVSFLSLLCTITHKNKILYLICYFHKHLSSHFFYKCIFYFHEIFLKKQLLYQTCA